ncbi:MAG: Rne/Rng family ribonuclease, partial [Planctomycetota bacterium]|nr:Rne/Rng family ribonuclease [Planctomycetota bacterium]
RSRSRRRSGERTAESAEGVAGAAGAAESTSNTENASSEGSGSEGAPRTRRRGSRGGRRRRSKAGSGEAGKRSALAVEAIPGEEDLADLPAEGGRGEDGAPTRTRRKRTRRGGRGRKKVSDSGDANEEAAEDSGAEPRRKAGRKKATKKRTGRSSSAAKTDEELEAEALADRTESILVNAEDQEEKRVAVVRGDLIVDFLMTSENQQSLVNDIYRGRVVNLEPAIGAAFIDFGQGRNGFLHTSDVVSAYGEKDFNLKSLLTSQVEIEEWDGASSQPMVGAEISDEVAVPDEDEESDAEPDAAAGAEPDAETETDAETAEGDSESPKEEKSAGRGQRGKKKGSRQGTRQGTRQGGRSGRERKPISDLLKKGDQVVVQVTKDAIGDKGPTLTTYLSIPGRYLVLMPSVSHTGVSRKIPDDKERRRLKRILSSIKVPEGMGVIVRTAGIGKTKTDLQRDVNYLLGVWENLGQKLEKGRGPAVLYQESSLAIRTLRDLFNARTKEVVIDDSEVYEEVMSFANELMPDQVDRIKRHEGGRPLFHEFGVEQDFEKIFARRAELPSGGSIIFDQAEALVAIDVNSGRTRTKSFDFEEVALKTNLEAVPEIARQIRLRDLGGIIVCDFIDMMKSTSNRQVERALRDEFATDRARSKMGRMSQFGLLEMTRQRLGPGVHKKVFTTCARCRGTGSIRSVASRAQAIIRRLGAALTQKGFSKVEVRAHPEVVDFLKADLWDYVRAMEHRSERELDFIGVPDQAEDSVLRYLRTDGREVRPGGRRKR